MNIDKLYNREESEITWVLFLDKDGRMSKTNPIPKELLHTWDWLIQAFDDRINTMVFHERTWANLVEGIWQGRDFALIQDTYTPCDYENMDGPCVHLENDVEDLVSCMDNWTNEGIFDDSLVIGYQDNFAAWLDTVDNLIVVESDDFVFEAIDEPFTVDLDLTYFERISFDRYMDQTGMMKISHYRGQ